MMYNYPLFGFPNFRRKPYNTFYNSYNSNLPNYYEGSFNMPHNPYHHIYNSKLHNIKHKSDCSNSPNTYFPKGLPNSSCNNFSKFDSNENGNSKNNSNYFGGNKSKTNSFYDTTSNSCSSCDTTSNFCNNDIFSTYDDNVISIFGFDFHFDDLLIIALLFFLYKERC